MMNGYKMIKLELLKVLKDLKFTAFQKAIDQIEPDIVLALSKTRINEEPTKVTTHLTVNASCK